MDCESGGVLTIFAVEWLVLEKTFLMESLTLDEDFWSPVRIAEDLERFNLGKEKKLFSFLVEDGVDGTAGRETGETELFELTVLFRSLALLFAEVAEGTEIVCEDCGGSCLPAFKSTVSSRKFNGVFDLAADSVAFVIRT